MSHFSNSRPSFGKKAFGNKGGFGNRGPKEMHKAKCATCGKDCEVPFKPSGNKPVYCNDCFVKDDSSRGSRRDFGHRNDKPAPRPDQAFNDLKAELRVVNQNLERLISIMTPVAAVEKSPKTTREPKAVKSEKKEKISKKKASKK